jgi:hypothetical protein
MLCRSRKNVKDEMPARPVFGTQSRPSSCGPRWRAEEPAPSEAEGISRQYFDLTCAAHQDPFHRDRPPPFFFA